MTRWSATTPTRRSCSALAYGSRSTAAAENTSTSSYTTTGDATIARGAFEDITLVRWFALEISEPPRDAREECAERRPDDDVENLA